MTTSSRALVLGLTILAGARSAAAAADAPAGADTAAAHGTYQIDPARSRFIVETQTSGLSTMFAHDHRIEIRDFGGQATFARNQKSGSLQVTVRPKSMVLVGEDDLGARQAIESTLRDDVLDTAKFPEITFKTKSASSTRRGDGTFDVRLVGELNLHGVKRQIAVPARVSLDPGALHAIGVFEVKQTDYAITPFSFASGTVGVKDTVTLSFDIIATQLKS